MHWEKFEQKKCKQYNHSYFLKQSKNSVQFKGTAIYLNFLIKRGFFVCFCSWVISVRTHQRSYFAHLLRINEVHKTCLHN